MLVAHTTSGAGRSAVLTSRTQAIEPVLTALTELLGAGRPSLDACAPLALGQAGRPASIDLRLWHDLPDGRQVGLAGDQWCPDGAPRVESAWRSGTDLGAALLPAEWPGCG